MDLKLDTVVNMIWSIMGAERERESDMDGVKFMLQWLEFVHNQWEAKHKQRWSKTRAQTETIKKDEGLNGLYKELNWFLT